MEDIPPSYDDSINANVLDLLPSYLSTASLVKLCLVSKSYYTTFIPYLWGSPASHFVQVASESFRTTNGINFGNLQVSGSQNDMVYVALTRFKRILRRARLSTRLLCHTLHLPPALSEIYGGPNATWLREVLDWLPALQSLCVSGLPFFDHDSLVAVDQSRNSSTPSNLDDHDFRRYPAKLLLAAKEPNVTWIGLSLLMPHLPDLVYLDLSYTSPARNTNVLQSLHSLTHLQVLKLRGIGLRDNELEILANVIGLRVRLLDVSENLLSDSAVRSLLQACVWLPSTRTTNGNLPNEQYSRRHLESWPVGLPPPPDSLSLNTIRTVELDEALLNQLTNPLTGRLAFEDIPHGGVTHLYIGGNPGVTIEGVRSILDLGRLHVLDAGDIGALTAVDLQVLAARNQPAGARDAASRSIGTNSKNIRGLLHRHRNRASSTYSSESGPTPGEQDEGEDIIRLPGAEKLVPVLREKASRNLTHLRIDHALVTEVLDITKEMNEKDKAIADKIELPDTLSRAAELDTTTREIYEAPGSRTYATEVSSDTTIFEMDATPMIPRAELPGDPIHFAISPPIGDTPQPSMNQFMSPIRGEGAMAPEVVAESEQSSPVSEEDVVLNATGSGVRRTDTSATAGTLDSQSSTQSFGTAADRPGPLQIRKQSTAQSTGNMQQVSRTTSATLSQIDDLTNLRPKRLITRLHPSFLPNLRTLILTNVPCRVPASAAAIIENLKAFIAACAAEARLATLRATINYSLPPGRARQEAERQHTRTLFALRTIVLEIDPEPDLGPQRGWKHTRQRLNISKSSTGDMDSEALWSAAENDFSFFGEEGEELNECGIYDQEPDKYYPTISFDEKIVVSQDDPPNRSEGQNSLATSKPASFIGGYGSPGATLVNPIMRNGAVMQSPRNLPLGRNRRTSNDMQRGSRSPTVSEFRPAPRSNPSPAYFEMPGTTPASRPAAPTSNPTTKSIQPAIPAAPAMLDVVSELASWRKQRKAAYEAELANHIRRASSTTASLSSSKLAEAEIYIEGYWVGEVKVVRNAREVHKGKMERQGSVDVYGNYFEGGYLYP